MRAILKQGLHIETIRFQRLRLSGTGTTVAAMSTQLASMHSDSYESQSSPVLKPTTAVTSSENLVQDAG